MSSAPIMDTAFLATVFWVCIGLLALIIFLASVLPRLTGGWYVSRNGIELGPYYTRRGAIRASQGRPGFDPAARAVTGGQIVRRGRSQASGSRSS